MTNSPTQPSLPPLNYENTPVEDLEQLRPRLTQLTHSLKKIEEALRNLHYSQSSTIELTAIQNQFSVILQQLSSLSKTLQNHKERLSVTNVFPNREFNTMSGLLFNLLRKKLTPEVEEWLKTANEVALCTNFTKEMMTSSTSPPSTSNSSNTINTAAATTNSNIKPYSNTLETLLFKDDEFTDEIMEFSHESLEDYMFGGYLTKAELDQGLKITDVLKNVTKEELEPTQSPSSTVNSLSENDLLRFIYQGLDSSVSLK
ncbi:mediator of RNA polymerase II transcription subunit 8 [Pichia californica]|uniref:Mediator of RNA polymerase II transcription subunit 8 n=1 Tax=Pichia californica TaxID=460514 RepID=A0A9P6WJ83_9ASCO|nr:mediator of RNA polymerase II transcription subunit 8 [[Candida] californica]